MKKCIFLLFALSLFAQEPEKRSIWDYHPIHVGGNAIGLGQADVDVRRTHQTTGNITYNKVNAFLYCFVPVSSTSFFLPRVEWNAFTMDWNENPRFQEKHFQFVQFALTFFSIGLEKWRWISRVNYNIDTKHFSEPGMYGLFEALLWGAHEVHRKWHYHVGAFGYTGFEGAQVYPIIGFDYAPNKKWFFQLIFPITYSIDYNLNERWRISLKGRPLKERFRTGKEEIDPKSVFCYSTMGAEFNLHYEKFLNLEAELFAGYNFGGSFYIKDQHGQNPLYTNVQGAPYVGASLNWGI